MKRMSMMLGEDSKAVEMKLKIAHHLGTKEKLAHADETFADMDEDGGGDIDIEEFKNAMSR
jgi:Ca2+-binding EF-hand superfamily protein